MSKKRTILRRESILADNKTLGILDSGVGGLSALKRLLENCPYEKIIYLGDTLNMPYGEKSPEEIKTLSLMRANTLVEEGAEEILVACGTICSNAGSFLRSELRAPVYSVIDFGAANALEKSRSGKIAVIATPASVSTGVFSAAVKSRRPNAKVTEISGGELAGRIENGFETESYFHDIIEPRLKKAFRRGCDCLLLGCTHYPHVKELFEAAAGKIPLADCAEAAAEGIIKLKNGAKKTPVLKFLISSEPEKFKEFAEKNIDIKGETKSCEIFEIKF